MKVTIKKMEQVIQESIYHGGIQIKKAMECLYLHLSVLNLDCQLKVTSIFQVNRI